MGFLIFHVRGLICDLEARLKPRASRLSVASSHQSPITNYKSFPGFTLIELLVAITITTIMLVIINQILFTTTEAVSTGAATSDMIATARTISDQMRRDADAMIAPATTGNAAGLLVIANRKVANVPIVTKTGEATRGYIRSDQLLFIRNGSGLEPFCPSNLNTFNNNFPGAYVRVWYGHVRRTAPDGRTFIDSSGNGSQDGGEPTVGDLGADTTGYNTIGSDWMLGRQAMHLAGGSTIKLNESITGSAYGYAAAVSGYGSNISSNIPPFAYSALSDVSNWKNVGTDTSTPDGMIGFSTLSNYTSYPLHTGQSGTNYQTNAKRFIYLAERLRCNPTPTYNAANAYTQYGAWQIAQMHAFLAGHVSDFIVDFAGDYENNATGAAWTNNTSIDGIDVVRSGETAATPTISQFPTSAVGNIKWYGTYNLARNFGVTQPPTVNNAPFSRDGADTTGRPIWLSSPNDDVFVFRHDTPPARWPHLLRIRYRVHDRKGRIGDGESAAHPDDVYNATTKTGDPGTGKWFEVILRVNRG